jgi:putative nucleotidyltransferase with HDIG domain
LLEKASVAFSSGQPIVFHGTIGEHEWRILKAENKQYLSEMRQKVTPLIKWCLGLTGIVLTITVMMAAYIAMNQPRVVRNSARGLAIAVLLILMLLLAQLAAIGSGPLYMFGLAPTLLAAMILCIAYDRRFAMGIASMHGLLVAIALNQGTGFFAILWAGSFTCCCLLDSIRNRSKLIEVGGTTALAMIGVTIAAGAMSQESMLFVAENCLYAGAAAMAVGFVVLGILPFVEKLFKISTGMTLLELGDSGQPLLRRLALEAPGTYNHSMQVAVLAEAAGEAIGGNSLLCRVASYYHDVGKIIKPDYFVENQTGGPSKHLNLSPNVSLLIIISHVKDGMALAKEYNLPQQILPFIQQHHGTTLVEYFYYQACVQKDQQQPNEPQVSDTEFRYPGPKPKSKEIAIVMLADTVESAARAMREPTAGSIENLVHELTMKRLLDGQFHECDLTMSELDQVERALTKTLQSIYHGRIAYPVLGTTAKAPVQPPLVQTNTA